METAHRKERSSPLDVEIRPRADLRKSAVLIRLRDGDSDALSELLERHWQGCVLYAKTLLDGSGDADVAEDMAQEAFIRLWQHRKRWKPGASPRFLLVRILRNLILNEARRLDVRRRSAPRVKAALRRPNPTPEELLAGQQVRERVRRTMASLPPRRREIFLLVRQQGLSYAEVARALGVTRQTVANQMSTALHAFRDALEPFL